MANIKIKLDSNRTINNVNVYSDMDMSVKYVAKTLYDRQAVKNSLTNILTWKPYERILDPSFGNTLWDTVFENIGNMSRGDITSMVSKMLDKEPRIKVLGIDVSINPQENEIYVSFSYSIPEIDDRKEQFNITITKM